MSDTAPASDTASDAASDTASQAASQADDVRRVSVLLGLLFGFAGMGSAAASMALAPLAATYGVSTGAAAWTISLYALMLGVGTAVYGRVADLQGPRLPMLIGLSLMTFGALLAALAPTFEIHLVGRLFQGAGAAAVPTLGAAVVTARYAGAVKSSALLRLAGTAAGVTSLGPLAGGLLVDSLSWRFAIALPILSVLVVPLLWHVMHVGGTGARLDFLGALLTALAAAGVVLLLQSPSTGLPVALTGLLLVVLGMPAVAVWVRHRPHGFLPLAVIRNPVVVRSALAAAAIPAAWFAMLVAIPATLLHDGWAAWQVGLALVPSGIVALLMPRVVGSVIERLGAAGSLILAAFVASLALVGCSVGAALNWPALLIASVLGATVSFGIGQPSLSTAVSDSVSDSVRGVALGIATLVFMVGGSLGSAVVGGLGPVLGLGTSIAVLTVLPALGIVLVLPTLRAVPEPA